jgi:nitroreductase
MPRFPSRRDVLQSGLFGVLGTPSPKPPPGCLGGLLARRRMIRRFRPEPVSEAAIERILDAATRAPSAGHTEPWSFVVVRSPETRRRLARAALDQAFVAEAPVVVVPCIEADRSRGRYGIRGDRYGSIDVSFASMLLLLAVVEEGLGACFVGAFRDEEVARILALPASVQPLAVIPIGVPAERPPRLRRRPRRETIHRERW